MAEWLHWWIGSDPRSILWWQMCIRSVLIFAWALLLIRLAGKRVFGKNTSFDIVLGVILGSILSRALTGNARFMPTVAASAVIVLLHLLLARLSLRSRFVGHAIKGRETQLVQDGSILWANMRKVNITPHDLQAALRASAGTDNLCQIRQAFLERNGEISFIRR